MVDSQLADVLGSPVRRLLIDFLARPPDVGAAGEQDPSAFDPEPQPHSAREIAEHLGVHITTARFHLDLLIDAGIVQTQSIRSGVGRPHKVYSVRPGSLRAASSEQSYRRLAELLADSLAAGQHTTPEDAGAAWGRSKTAAVLGAGTGDPARSSGQWIGKIGQMVDVLQEWGYTPEIALAADGRTARVSLRDCPFLELAAKHPDVVCGVHRGLIRGTLEALGENNTEIGLEPFIGPTHCLAHLRTRSPFDRDQAHLSSTTAAPTRF